MKYQPKKVSAFYMYGKDYEANDKDLVRYSQDLFKSNEEYKTYHKFKGYKQRFDYFEPFKMQNGNYLYRTHDSNIINFFKLLTNKVIYNSFEKISKVEESWMEKTYNGGLQYSVKGEFQSYGYDFSNQYGSIMASKQFKIPRKQGKEYKLENIPEVDLIEYGFYKVVITCEHPDIKKIFAFSKDSVYTHYDLKYAMRLKEFYDIMIILNTDDEFNSYIYNKDDLINGYDIFYNWYETITELKQLFPKNILTKMLSSSLWGHLSTHKFLYPNEEELKNYKWGKSDDCAFKMCGEYENSDGSLYYQLFESENPYKYPLRLKSFLTALGRNKIANVALLEIDSVLRIHTDGVAFNKPFEHDIKNILPEKKTTGLKIFPIRHSRIL
jgi:hypothetical protein